MSGGSWTNETVRRLKRRAADNNRSLESEARHILEQAAGDDMAEKTRAFLDLSRRMRRQTAGSCALRPPRRC